MFYINLYKKILSLLLYYLLLYHLLLYIKKNYLFKINKKDDRIKMFIIRKLFCGIMFILIKIRIIENSVHTKLFYNIKFGKRYKIL